jgi:predicted lipoprotein with Yx(FWY)xxD motif
MPGIKGKFGVAVRTGGARQLTYDGAPLYLWFKDKKPGDMTGQGVGGVWWVVVAPRA